MRIFQQVIKPHVHAWCTGTACMGFTPERSDNAAFNPIPGLGARSAALSEPGQPQERGAAEGSTCSPIRAEL